MRIKSENHLQKLAPMRTLNLAALACRHCQHYTPEGRRGGHCHQLGVPVQGCWKACSLAIPPFAPSWENFSGISTWHQGKLTAYPQVCAQIDIPEESTSITEKNDRKYTSSVI